MAGQGRAAITQAMERCWRDLLEVRDSLREHGMGRASARLTLVCTELDDLGALLAQRVRDPVELSAELGKALANRATLYAAPLASEVRVTGDAFVDEQQVTCAIAKGFVMGYGAALDDHKSATTITRERRRAKR